MVPLIARYSMEAGLTATSSPLAPSRGSEAAADAQQRMNIVIVGHVDHGKSTVIGRLLADTHSLPEGKLEQVRAQCELNSKPFEFAFLLDALKDEQAQGITIDAARVFFKSRQRHYLILDAPGHIEFLKNMITGAARAEAALLVIDAAEGVQENSRRHGYMVSLLGIRQLSVVVNKMDLVDWDRGVRDQPFLKPSTPSGARPLRSTGRFGCRSRLSTNSPSRATIDALLRERLIPAQWE
jgi:small GTP-binding protein